MKKNTKIPDAVFSFFFVIFPAIIIYLFLTPDFRKNHLDNWILILINFGYLIYIICITNIFYKLNIVNIKFIINNISLAICFIVIFLTYPLKNSTLEVIGRIAIVLTTVLVVIPITIFIKWIQKKNYQRKMKIKYESK